jgi:uncharacterized protein (TIGR02996 family)
MLAIAEQVPKGAGNNPKPDDDEPVQMSAYRAPKGGAIVRGTQYKGGSMIPDMRGEFMNPRRKLARQVRRYSENDRQAFLKKIASEPNEKSNHKVFADWLEENDPTAHPTTVKRLRNYDGPLHVTLSPSGRVLAIPTVTKKLLEDSAAKNVWKQPTGPFFHATSRNMKGQAHRVRVSGKLKTWKRDANRFRVPWKFGLRGNGEITEQNAHQWLTEDHTQEPS